MNRTSKINRLVIAGLLALLCDLVLLPPAVRAETYVAGQFGVTLPSIGKGLTDIDLTGSFTPGSTTSDQGLKSSVLWGAKVGRYFKSIPWFGLEAEFYNTTPHIKQQTIEFRGPMDQLGLHSFLV